MTQCKFYSEGGLLTGFELHGHAGGGHAGKDVVCAAVSSAAYMTVNTITDIYGIPAYTSVEEGNLRMRLTHDGAEKCRELLEGFHLHLVELQKQYPKNIQVINTEV